MSKSQVLVVDDDPDLCELIEDTLSDCYVIHTCHDIKSASETFSKVNPGIVVLDINLPNGNGLSLCQDLIQNADNFPLVMMISGDAGADMQLEAYNSGGADFLPKPFRIRELRARVDKLNEFYQHQSRLQESSSVATATAMSAMAEASQYGEVLRFYNAMYSANSIEKICDCFFTLMESFGLQTSVQLRAEGTYTFDHGGRECSPIELQIYENFYRSKRVISFSSRLLINGQYVSAIIKNMPSDELCSGRMRDILATLVEGIDAKLLDLQRLELLKRTAAELAQSSGRLGSVMKCHENDMTSAMSHVISEMTLSFDHLNMTDEQERFFIRLTEQVLNKLEESFVPIGHETQVLDCLRMSLSTVLNRSPS